MFMTRPNLCVQLTIGSLLLACLAGCSSSSPNHEPELLSLQEIGKAEYLKDFEAAVFLSSMPEMDDSDQKSVVVLIREDGSTVLAKSDALDVGQIASRPGELMIPTANEMRIIGKGYQTRQFDARDDAPSGVWSGVSGDGSFVTVLNTGYGDDGYITDIYAEADKAVVHSVMPDVPGAMGIGGSDLFSLNAAESTSEGEVTLYATDLRAQSSTRKVSTWRYGDPDESEFDSGRNMFAVNGKLWFLELIYGVDADSPGETVHLSAIDLKTGKHQSTAVVQYPDSMWGGADDSAVGNAGTGTHFYEGAIFTVDHSGHILSANLRTKKWRNHGQVSTEMMNSDRVVATWTEDRLNIVGTDAGRGKATLETYNVVTGKRTRSIPVPDLAELASTDKSYLTMWSLADLG